MVLVPACMYEIPDESGTNRRLALAPLKLTTPENVGVLLNTTLPLPVSLVRADARSAEVKPPESNEATPPLYEKKP